MQHLGMELYRIEAVPGSFRCCCRAVCGMRCDFKSGRRLGDVVKVAHPADCGGGNIFKYLGVRLVDEHFCLSILPYIRSFYPASQHMHHQLRAIAQAENRYAKLKKFFCISRGICLVAAVRPSCQNDSFRIHCLYFFYICLIRIDLAIYAALSDTPCDQLIILPSEIQDND